MDRFCGNCFNNSLNDQQICTICGFNNKLNHIKAPHSLPAGTILNGRYIIGRVLGQGGFGITYTARDHQTGQLAAIKEFFPDSMATRTDRTTVTPFYGERGENFTYGRSSFLQEAETMAQFIGNPNIIRVYSYFEENGTAYFVMEYVDGVSLQEHIKSKGGKLSFDDALDLLMPVMDALSVVHEKGIIHRDVTPDNIYISRDGTVKLLDFGAARYSLGNVSRSLDVILKHGFAPKEQYKRRGRQGPYTDVYALGATLYYSITGVRPDDAIDRSDEDDMPYPTSLGAQITPQQEAVLLKAMAVDYQDRYQTMVEFKNAICNLNSKKEPGWIDILRKQQEELRRKQEEEKRRQEELRKQQEEHRRQEELRKKQEEEKRRQEELRRKQEEEKRRQEELRRKQEEEKRRQQELSRKQEEEKRRQQELHRKQEEEKRRQQELRRKQEEEKRRQEELLRKQEEEKHRQEALRKQQEEGRRKEQKLHLSEEKQKTEGQQQSSAKWLIPLIGIAVIAVVCTFLLLKPAPSSLSVPTTALPETEATEPSVTVPQTEETVPETTAPTEPSPEDLYSSAITAFESGDYATAKSIFESLGNYGDSQRYLRLILVYERKGSLGTGENHSCVLKDDGTVLSFGLASTNRLDTDHWTDIIAVSVSDHTMGLRADGTVLSTKAVNEWGSIGGWDSIIDISAGKYISAGLRSDGTVMIAGSIKCEDTVSKWTDIVDVACSDYAVFGLRSDGTVVTAGKNDGIKNCTEWTDIIAISGGHKYLLGLRKDGTVVSTGNDEIRVSKWTDIVAISAGYEHAVGLRADGTVVSTGENIYGQCNASEWEDIVAISAGRHHTLALQKDGTLVGIGSNAHGRRDP